MIKEEKRSVDRPVGHVFGALNGLMCGNVWFSLCPYFFKKDIDKSRGASERQQVCTNPFLAFQSIVFGPIYITNTFVFLVWRALLFLGDLFTEVHDCLSVLATHLLLVSIVWKAKLPKKERVFRTIKNCFWFGKLSSSRAIKYRNLIPFKEIYLLKYITVYLF